VTGRQQLKRPEARKKKGGKNEGERRKRVNDIRLPRENKEDRGGYMKERY